MAADGRRKLCSERRGASGKGRDEGGARQGEKGTDLVPAGHGRFELALGLGAHGVVDFDDAEDLIADAREKCLANIDKMPDAEKEIGAWVYVIMRNHFINNYRREARKRELLPGFFYESTSQVSNTAFANLQLQEVLKSLDEIREEEKNALLLYAEGYKYHEIAKAMHVPQGTIKSRIHFAREHIKKFLKKQNPPD